jgi:FixJ family two-component response regulator
VALYESGEALLAQLPKDAGSNCILLDVRIPGLSGPELQVRLNDIGSHLPIIFLTGHGDISTTVQVIKAGAEDLLTNPSRRTSCSPRLSGVSRAGARGRRRTRSSTVCDGS